MVTGAGGREARIEVKGWAAVAVKGGAASGGRHKRGPRARGGERGGGQQARVTKQQ
jgi:hypothetical protein